MATEFDRIKRGDWIKWRDMSGAFYSARVDRVYNGALRLDFGRASINRAEFERMGVKRIA